MSAFGLLRDKEVSRLTLRARRCQAFTSTFHRFDQAGMTMPTLVSHD